MEKDFEHIDDLIARFLSLEVTVNEIIALQEWRDLSPENELYFNESKKIFDAVAASATAFTVDTDAAWNKLNNEITAGAKIISINKNRTFIRVAASMLLIVALSLIVTWFFSEPESQPVLYAAGNTSLEQVLPDGSKVFINKNSEISFVQNKNGQREVALKGEAFFEVIHNEKQPFVITINNILIKDIGTAFNVKANPESNTIDVYVESGEVQFYSPDNNGLILEAGEKARYDKTSATFSKIVMHPSENTTSYRTKSFIFKGTLLKEVISQLNDVYGCQIHFDDPGIGEEHLSTIFNNETLEGILTIITETLDLEVEQTGTNILLKRKTG